MANQPDPNRTEPEKEIPQRDHPSGGDTITTGDVGVGASVGRGSVVADNIAGRDIIIHNGKSAEDDKAEFSSGMLRLKELIVKAYRAGELNEKTAKKALANLTETDEMITKEQKPPKAKIVGRLQYIADVLDAAVDFLGTQGGVAKVLLEALPVAALLVKIATRIF